MFEDTVSELRCCPNLNVALPCRAARAGPKAPRKKSSSAVILRSSSGPEHREGRISRSPENIQTEILRAVYPERQCEILRCAQDDSERAQDASIATFFRSASVPDDPSRSAEHTSE